MAAPVGEDVQQDAGLARLGAAAGAQGRDGVEGGGEAVQLGGAGGEEEVAGGGGDDEEAGGGVEGAVAGEVLLDVARGGIHPGAEDDEGQGRGEGAEAVWGGR